MKRVEITYGGERYSLSDTDAATVRAQVDAALADGRGWLTVNQGEGLPRETFLLITSGVSFGVADVAR